MGAKKTSRGDDVFKEIRQLTQKVRSLSEELEILQQKVLGTVERNVVQQNKTSLLICLIGTDHAALLLDFVDCVVPAAKLTPYPEAPNWIPGYLNFHGSIVPVIDVSVRISNQDREMKITDYIVICNLHNQLYGLLVQDVVNSCDVETLILVDDTQQIKHAAYLVGVINNLDSPTPLLSVEKLILSSRIPDSQGDG